MIQESLDIALRGEQITVRQDSREWKEIEETRRSQILEEFEACAPEQVVLAPLFRRRLEDRSHEVVLDHEAIVELVGASDASSQESEGGEAEVRVARQARLRAE